MRKEMSKKHSKKNSKKNSKKATRTGRKSKAKTGNADRATLTTYKVPPPLAPTLKPPTRTVQKVVWDPQPGDDRLRMEIARPPELRSTLVPGPHDSGRFFSHWKLLVGAIAAILGLSLLAYLLYWCCRRRRRRNRKAYDFSSSRSSSSVTGPRTLQARDIGGDPAQEQRRVPMSPPRPISQPNVMVVPKKSETRSDPKPNVENEDGPPPVGRSATEPQEQVVVIPEEQVVVVPVPSEEQGDHGVDKPNTGTMSPPSRKATVASQRQVDGEHGSQFSNDWDASPEEKNPLEPVFRLLTVPQ